MIFTTYYCERCGIKPVGKVGEEASCPKYCPKCAEELEREKNLKMARELWEEFADVIIDDNECIESSWRTFDAGTSRYDIWHWFEDFFGVSVAKDLMEVA